MTLKIVKPELAESNTPFDVDTARAAIAAGMVNDTVTNLHGAVKAAGASNGSQVTIDMGTGDVLPDIRIQFREEI